MGREVQNVNLQILIKCREQMGYNLYEIEKKVKSIAAIEKGNKAPTFKQLDTLADLYNVPRWVFISDDLPQKYCFDISIPAFRQFSEKRGDIFIQAKVRCLVAKVERFRDLVIELRKDMDEPITNFDFPELPSNLPLKDMSTRIREWLGVNVNSNLKIDQWKQKLEDKGVFIFMTSKYKGWSYVDKNLFRGLAIYHPVLPIVIINDSDAKKAQSFTLFHELAHLIRKESEIDSWDEHSDIEENIEIENWCDQLSAEVLMPEERFYDIALRNGVNSTEDVKTISLSFKVSPYACLVRLRILGLINQHRYKNFQEELKEEYEQRGKRIIGRGGSSRNRAKEVIDQYGRIYVNTLFHAYNNDEISLHKLYKSFDLKRTSHVFELERGL